MNPTSTKNYKETPLRRITEVKRNSYKLIGISPGVSFGTDLISELVIPIDNPRSVTKRIEKVGYELPD